MTSGEEGITHPDKETEQDHSQDNAPDNKLLLYGRERLHFHLLQFFDKFLFFPMIDPPWDYERGTSLNNSIGTVGAK
jgi:hypothetical protein